jgi:lipid A 4'-phosphatase
MNDNATYRLKGWTRLTAMTMVLLILTWIIIELDLDRRIAARFYHGSEGWYLGDKQPWHWLYQYGTVPGLLLSLTALFAWFWSMATQRMKYLQRYFLVIVLTAILGPGVLVNGILKNYWSRPRPRQIEQFGGQWNYRHPHQPGIPGKGKSFPCGHCTMGFLFCSLMIFRKHKRWLAYTGGAFGLLLGGLLSAARMLQGAHYLSDTLWSMGILLMLPIALYVIILKRPTVRTAPAKQLSRIQKKILWFFFAVCLVVMMGGFLLHRPFYKDHSTPLNISQPVSRILVRIDTDIQTYTVRYSDTVTPDIRLTARGFAWIGAKHQLNRNLAYESGKLILDIQVEKKGFFSELTHEIQIRLPDNLRGTVDVNIVRMGSDDSSPEDSLFQEGAST